MGRGIPLATPAVRVAVVSSALFRPPWRLGVFVAWRRCLPRPKAEFSSPNEFDKCFETEMSLSSTGGNRRLWVDQDRGGYRKGRAPPGSTEITRSTQVKHRSCERCTYTGGACLDESPTVLQLFHRVIRKLPPPPSPPPPPSDMLAWCPEHGYRDRLRCALGRMRPWPLGGIRERTGLPRQDLRDG